MGILKSAADLVYTIRFLKLLVTPFEKMGAYGAGIIDKDGKKNPDFNTLKTDDREAYRTHYTPFIRLVINLKRLMAKVPGGQSVITVMARHLHSLKNMVNYLTNNLCRFMKKRVSISLMFSQRNPNGLS